MKTDDPKQMLAGMGIRDVSDELKNGTGIIAGAYDRNGNRTVANVDAPPRDDFDPACIRAGQVWIDRDGHWSPGRRYTTHELLPASDTSPPVWRTTYTDEAGETGTANLAPKAFAQLWMAPPPVVTQSKVAGHLDAIEQAVSFAASDAEVSNISLKAKDALRALRELNIPQLEILARLGRAQAALDPIRAGLAAAALLVGNDKYGEAGQHITMAVAQLEGLLGVASRAQALIGDVALSELTEEDRIILAAIHPASEDRTVVIRGDLLVAEVIDLIRGPTAHPQIVEGRIRHLLGIGLIDVVPPPPGEEIPGFRLTPQGFAVLGN